MIALDIAATAITADSACRRLFVRRFARIAKIPAVR